MAGRIYLTQTSGNHARMDRVVLESVRQFSYTAEELTRTSHVNSSIVLPWLASKYYNYSLIPMCISNIVIMLDSTHVER